MGEYFWAGNVQDLNEHEEENNYEYDISSNGRDLGNLNEQEDNFEGGSLGNEDEQRTGGFDGKENDLGSGGQSSNEYYP